MYEAAFKNIDDTLWKDAGCSSVLDYIEQTSWVLFLKYLDDYETEKETAALLNGEAYARIIDGQFRWSKWAAPKKADGKIDHNAALTGDDLRDFVNHKLFPHLASFKQTAENPRSIHYKIGEIFSELRNKLQSGYALRDVIDKVDELKFLSNADKHELSSLYEDKIKNMGNAGRNGGEYYTPRPLITTIVKVVAPTIGNNMTKGVITKIVNKIRSATFVGCGFGCSSSAVFGSDHRGSGAFFGSVHRGSGAFFGSVHRGGSAFFGGVHHGGSGCFNGSLFFLTAGGHGKGGEQAGEQERFFHGGYSK